MRRYRFTFNEKNIYLDLVLCNRFLRCYVLVDFKVAELTHQDLGQMQMYVNCFDRYAYCVMQPHFGGAFFSRTPGHGLKAGKVV